MPQGEPAAIMFNSPLHRSQIENSDLLTRHVLDGSRSSVWYAFANSVWAPVISALRWPGLNRPRVSWKTEVGGALRKVHQLVSRYSY